MDCEAMVACMQLLKEKQLFPCVQPPRLAPPPARQTLVLPRSSLMWLAARSLRRPRSLPPARRSSSLPGWFVPTVAPASWIFCCGPHPPLLRSLLPAVRPSASAVCSFCLSVLPLASHRCPLLPGCCLPPVRSLVPSVRLSLPRSCAAFVRARVCLFVASLVRAFARSFAACLSSPFGRSAAPSWLAALAWLITTMVSNSRRHRPQERPCGRPIWWCPRLPCLPVRSFA